MSERYRFSSFGPGVIRLSDNAFIPPGETAAWNDYMYRVLYESYEAEPAEPINTPTPTILKTTIIERLSDSELESLDAARQTRPLRERYIWETAQTVNPNDEMLRAFFVAVIGDSRTNEVLAVEE